MLRKPRYDLVSIGRVDAQKKLSGPRQPIDEDIVLDAALLVADHRVLRLHGPQRSEIVRRHALKERFRAGAGDDNPPHMADIEETDLASNGVILIHNAGVVDGHFPTREVDQLRPGGAMLCDERGMLHRMVTAPRAIRRRKSAWRSVGSRRRHRAIHTPNRMGW